jgi:hypothetical protein
LVSIKRLNCVFSRAAKNNGVEGTDLHTFLPASRLCGKGGLESS